MFPTIAEYNQVIQSKGNAAFKSLSEFSFVPSRTLPVKIYSYGSGSYAVVFKAADASRQYAIRCFISAEQENIDRYRSIHEYLKRVSASWVTGLELLENEVTVGGKAYPVVKMEWVEGKLLNSYIDGILHDNNALNALQEEIVSVSKSLEANQVGHGDIQCGNVIVTTAAGKPVLKLIDYDGMYIPSFSNRANLERGRSEFQHPQRFRQAYNEKIDRFSFWVLLCALEALKYDKSLWLEVMQGGFNTLDNVLFQGDDLKTFNSSKLVNRLYGLHQPSLTYYLDKLNKFCHSSPSDTELPVLFTASNTELESFSPKIAPTTAGEKIQITSAPSGAPVLTSAFKRLGSTPILLDRAAYLNKTLIVSNGTETKQVQVLEHLTEINIIFSEEKRQAASGFTPSLPTQTSTASLPAGSPVPPSPVQGSQVTPVQKENDYSNFFLALSVLLLIVVGAAIWLMEKEKNNREVNSGDIYNETSNTTTTDTTITTSYPPVDYTTAPVVTDTTSVGWTGATDATTDTLIETTTYSSPYVDASSRTAKEVVQVFFTYLDNKDCESAWGVTYNPTWEANGKDWFCSYEAFGTVSKVQVEQVYTISESATEALVYASYYAEDPYNGNKCYKQNVTLKKTFLENRYYWMITKLTNLEEPYSCTLVP